MKVISIFKKFFFPENIHIYFRLPNGKLNRMGHYFLKLQSKVKRKTNYCDG